MRFLPSSLLCLSLTLALLGCGSSSQERPAEVPAKPPAKPASEPASPPPLTSENIKLDAREAVKQASYLLTHFPVRGRSVVADQPAPEILACQVGAPARAECQLRLQLIRPEDGEGSLLPCRMRVQIRRLSEPELEQAKQKFSLGEGDQSERELIQANRERFQAESDSRLLGVNLFLVQPPVDGMLEIRDLLLFHPCQPE